MQFLQSLHFLSIITLVNQQSRYSYDWWSPPCEFVIWQAWSYESYAQLHFGKTYLNNLDNRWMKDRWMNRDTEEKREREKSRETEWLSFYPPHGLKTELLDEGFFLIHWARSDEKGLKSWRIVPVEQLDQLYSLGQVTSSLWAQFPYPQKAEIFWGSFYSQKLMVLGFLRFIYLQKPNHMCGI